MSFKDIILAALQEKGKKPDEMIKVIPYPCNCSECLKGRGDLKNGPKNG